MWENKRANILQRDNYTCQVCNDFNPSLGLVNYFYPEDGDQQIHEYDSSPRNLYMITSYLHRITINVNFGQNFLVLPVLQVHHKKYINGKENWDYEDKDLVTLCKNCHINLHLNHKIPVFESNGTKVEERIFVPRDLDYGRVHNYPSWVFIAQSSIKGEYVLSSIHPEVTYVILGSEDKDEMEAKAKLVLDNFLSRHLKKYVKKG